MIYPLGGLLIGAVIGAFSARAPGGKGLDMAQWAAVLGIICALIGLFVLIFIERSALAT